MKKTMWVCALLAGATATGYGQESRQDVSISGMGVFAPQVNGQSNRLNTNSTLGALVSYRYLLTPRSGLEANYSFAQYTDIFNGHGEPTAIRVHTRQQEATVAYVYSRNYRRFNPFVEVGVGAMFFSPLRDFGTQSLDVKRTTGIGGLFGGGVAYELSPSFDLRLEYRGFFVKAPTLGLQGSNYSTNAYEVISTPALGVAYHF